MPRPLTPPDPALIEQVQMALGLTDERAADIEQIADTAHSAGWRIRFSDGTSLLALKPPR